MVKLIRGIFVRVALPGRGRGQPGLAGHLGTLHGGKPGCKRWDPGRPFTEAELAGIRE